MPSWNEIMAMVNNSANQDEELNRLRNEYLNKIHSLTGRNVIAYYSGWLKDPGVPNATIDEKDKNAFMSTVYKLDKSRGLDLILHTPGGDLAATESIVTYLKSKFNGNVRAIVPQISMSAGTLIAIACHEIIMGDQSSLGPVDPQMGGVACQAVIDEFYKAVTDIQTNPASLGLWQSIVSKYHPTFMKECENSIKWAEDLTEQWLNESNPGIEITKFKDVFLNHNTSYSHSRHISKNDCKKAGLNIMDLESNQDLQDAVLSLHHCYMIVFDKYKVSKMVENQLGGSYMLTYS